MAKPPYGELAGIAKHATDEVFLSHRDDFRWLARWADDIHAELRTIWNSSTITVSPLDDNDYRQVDISLKLTKTELETLLHMLDEAD